MSSGAGGTGSQLVFMRRSLACWSVVSLLLVAGCASPGLPARSRQVGGGLSVDWRAPQAGTAMIREETTRRIVATQSLGEGDTFAFPDHDNHREALFKLFGEPMPTNLVFVLYFVPE